MASRRSWRSRLVSAAEPLNLFGGTEHLSSAIYELLERVGPSVVQVCVGHRGAGSGVVWNKDGGVITNYHVVGDGRWPIEVRLADGRKAPAEVIRTQPAADLAPIER